MQKCLIFLLALFSLTVQARANWNPYSMDHERFVHLNDEEKRIVIIRTMEFMVELEANYKKDVQVSGYSPDRYQKYVKALKQLQNLLLSSAHAQLLGKDRDLLSLAGGFGSLLDSLKNEGCVYGGYVSRMAVTAKGEKYCQHPSRVPLTTKDGKPDEKAKAIHAAYASESHGKSCVGPDKITCNPVIFGYDKVVTPLVGVKPTLTPTCVDTGHMSTGTAHNVSYACMNKALSGTDQEQKERLDVVVKAMSASPEAFKKVHNFVFTTCACGKTSIDAQYAEYIKPHRTCFGMMNALRVMKNNECEAVDRVKSADFANEWSQYFGKKVAFPELKPEKSGQFDKDYEKLINKDAVKAICENIGKEEKPSYSCEATCTEEKVAAGAADSWLCKITKAQKVITKGTQVSTPTDVETKLKEFKVADPKLTVQSVDLKDGGKVDCKFAIKPKEAAQTCAVAITDDTDPKGIKVKISFTGLLPNDKPVISWPEGASSTAEAPLEAVITRKETAQSVPLKYAVSGHPGKAVCSIEIPAIVPEVQKKYTIEAKAEAPATDDAVTIKVVAVVKVDGVEVKDMKGLKISWNRQGYVAGTPKVEEKPKSDTKVKTDDEKKDEKKDDKKETEGGTEVIVKPGEEPVKVGTDLTIDEPRTLAQYKSCATLLDEKGTAVAGPSCDSISPLKVNVPPKPTNLNNFPQGGQNQPAPFVAPQNHTRMNGIR